MVTVGKVAPAFVLESSEGGEIALKDLLGGWAVVYFYPKADTPGCTKQACAFRDSAADYAKRKIKVVGISPDPIAKVMKFVKKFKLNFPLLADPDHSVCEKYGVWGQKTFWGRKYMGVLRTTFIVDAAGKAAQVFEKVEVEGHEVEVLKWIEERAD